jgi:hypothetical protein
MPIDYKLRDPAWPQVRARILARAGNCCEECGVHNHAAIFRYKADPARWRDPNSCDLGESDPEVYPVTIVLTVAHLLHNEHEWPIPDDTLKALCQRCHLRLDAPEKARRRREKAASTPLPLFALPPVV